MGKKQGTKWYGLHRAHSSASPNQVSTVPKPQGEIVLNHGIKMGKKNGAIWVKAKRGVAQAEEAKLNLWQICPHPQDWRGVRKAAKKMRTLTSVRCRRRKFHFKEGLKHQDKKTGAKDKLVNVLCPVSRTGRGQSLGNIQNYSVILHWRQGTQFPNVSLKNHVRFHFDYFF